MMVDNLALFKRATVHLECARDSLDEKGRYEEFKRAADELTAGRLAPEDMVDSALAGIRDIRSSGTALFLNHGARHYLVTCRHLLWDEETAEKDVSAAQEHAVSDPSPSKTAALGEIRERSKSLTYPVVFRMPSFGSLNPTEQGNLEHNHIWLADGPSGCEQFTFSDEELDLAVISLDQRARGFDFREELLRDGYRPISSDLIADEPTAEGSDYSRSVSLARHQRSQNERCQQRRGYGRQAACHCRPVRLAVLRCSTRVWITFGPILAHTVEIVVGRWSRTDA